MQPEPFDHVIIGAGVSGLTLADSLSASLPPSARILLIDKDDDPDYNISFWLPGDPPFAPVMKHGWSKIAVRHGQRRTVCPLRRYRLHAFWRDDFDAHLHEVLSERPNVELLDAAVRSVEEAGDHALIHTDEAAYRARWAYDSRFHLKDLLEFDPEPMLMQGLAVEIEVDEPAFDPEVATLFDFLLDSPQFDFMYVLPYTPRHALVNAAFVTPFETLVEEAHCEAVIDRYVRERLGVQSYEIQKRCYGRLPLADHFPARRPGGRILPIGMRGGMIKASTSYAFTRILADAQRIAQTLSETGQPHYEAQSPWYYRAADRYTSEVFHRAPSLAQELMFGMFTPQTGDLALAFLDERNSLAENRELFENLPSESLERFLGELVMTALGRDAGHEQRT